MSPDLSPDFHDAPHLALFTAGFDAVGTAVGAA